jgi:hypothetical protein
MSDRNRRNRKGQATVPLDAAKGNALFEKAIAAIGLEDAPTRWLVTSVLKTIGAKPTELTPEDLGNLLPEVDRRLRKLIPDPQADLALKRLYRVLFDHAESA